MIIYPALDLLNGQCVRLVQGDFGKSTSYGCDPLAIAKSFCAEGAKWLHIIDLDAAKDPSKSKLLEDLNWIKNIPANIQFGGGIRNELQIRNFFKAGGAKVILGTQAIKSSQEVKEWFKTFGPERFILALDVFITSDQEIAIALQGWQERATYQLSQLIQYYKEVGLIHVLCTDIMRDGVLLGPNFALYQTILNEYPDLQIQASGGISSLEDLRKLKEIGVAGAIVGRALYENKFTLSEALSC